MTAMDDGFEFEDPEETAGSAANSAFQKVMLRRLAALLGVFAVAMGAVIADYVLGVTALWLLPRALVALLAGFMAAEFSLSVRGYLASSATRRKAGALLSEGERQLAALDRMRDQQVPPPWWLTGPRSRRFWAGLALRAVYSAAAGLVLAHFLGMVVGVILALTLTVLAMAARARAEGVIAAWVTTASFADPRPPRDTPET
jgi:hypothetical protein